ncbi:predicted protein [Lichtheimia corymbifera JMRC:FSU:9682]|uniref:C2H2-type domain-containing protein n=1 Tax=Lichtheimia corymbifera JMRC:FSU:9682 TaxID=1263082 RepID=A0A068RXF7_9FUNG|nr:predicted protein [Lichtheimia corymbifera JMRC:FSU:9682]
MYKKTFYSDNFTVDPAFCSIDPNMLAMHHHHQHQQQDDVSPYVVPASVMPPTPTPFLDPSATPFSPDEGLDDFPVMYQHDEDNTTGMVDVAVAPYLTNYYQQQQQQQYHSPPQPTTVNNTPDMGAASINYHHQQQEHHLFPALAKAKVFTCPTCHRQFNRRYNLGTHMKTHDKNRHRPYACPDAFISKLYNGTWGLQSYKVARRDEAHLGCKFHDQARHSQIHPMSPPAKVEKKIQEVDPRSTLAGGDIAKSRIDEVDRETCTQGALHPDEQLCSIEDPTFHCKV